MRILIIGSDENAYLTAKIMSELDNVDLVFVAPGNKHIKEFANSIDIPADNSVELLDFAKANEINLTVITSESAISNSVTNVFTDEGLTVFGPSINSARIVLSKSSAKKFMYKLRVQTPKFGIFDKEFAAIDYARKSKFPMVIKNDVSDSINPPKVCPTFSKAKAAIEKLFEEFNKKIVIEDYIEAHRTSLYIITDGYTAFPLGCVTQDESQPFEAYYASDPSIGEDMMHKLMSRVVYPSLNEISRNASPYIGVLGLDLLIQKNNFQVLEFNHFFKPEHVPSILPLLDENLYDVSSAAAVGSLSDDYEVFRFRNQFAYSAKFAISELNDDVLTDLDDDVLLTYPSNDKVVFTTFGATLNSAKDTLFELLDSAPDLPQYEKSYEV